MAPKGKSAARVSNKSLGRPEGSSGVETRARLLRLAATLFAEKGFAGVTMADVAGAAGLTAPSIYNHFSSKDEMFVATVTQMYEEISLAFAAAARVEGGWQTRFASVLSAAAQLYRDDGVLQRLGAVAHLEAARAPQRYAPILAAQAGVEEVFVGIAELAVRDNALPASTDTAMAGELLASMVMVAMAKVTHRHSSQAEFDDIVATFTALFLNEQKGSATGQVRQLRG